MGKISIRGLTIETTHGVLGFEKTTPQPFVFDVDIFTDFTLAIKTDDVDYTVNYARACQLIESTAKDKTYNLIESLAYAVCQAIMDMSENISRVRVEVFKPKAPIKANFKDVSVSISCEREQVILSLGSSMGDRRDYLNRAIDMLEQTSGIRVKKVSSIIQTQPYGGVADNQFLNCAVEISTYLTPDELLERIGEIECALQRVRTQRWEDRTIDIDIIFFGRKIISNSHLTIPHCDYHNRLFVLEPLAEICPYFLCPKFNDTVNHIYNSFKKDKIETK